jgi:hypothetical protein
MIKFMMKRLTRLAVLLPLSLNFCPQMTAAQAPHKKAATGISSAPAIANYIPHEITKSGPGDHGIFFDTVQSKIKLTDPVNAAGKKYQDIKITLEAGDVIKAGLTSGIITPMTLTLLNSVNGHLSLVKAIIDTASTSEYKLFYKVPAAGAYTLRVTCLKRAPKTANDRDYYYENNTSYSVNCVMSTVASGVIMDNPAVCDQLQFLLRQRLTHYMQITGALSDTTMDVLDKKKIQSINHLSTFTFYKNSQAKINVDPYDDYVAFDQLLLYKSDEDALQAQRYFVEQFKACLDAGWTGAVDPSDANWYKFEKEGYNNAISIIFYPGYKYLQILM